MRRAVVAILVQEHARPVGAACRIAGLSRTAYYRPPRAVDDADAPIIAALTALIAQEGRWGFWKCRNRLRALGHPWNHKRVYRVYCALKLNHVRRTKKRVLTRVRIPLEAVPQLNDTWAMDFMGDTLYSARRYRIFNVLDEGNREALAIEVDVSLPSERVVAVLEQLVAIHGAPRRIRCDYVLHPLSRRNLRRATRKACGAHVSRVVYKAPRTPPAVSHTTRVPC